MRRKVRGKKARETIAHLKLTAARNLADAGDPARNLDRAGEIAAEGLRTAITQAYYIGIRRRDIIPLLTGNRPELDQVTQAYADAIIQKVYG